MSELASKPLRCSQLDLEITVGDGKKKKVYMYHSVVMALWSKYIDTALSTPMQGNKHMKLSFPDIEPDIWEGMMKLSERAELAKVRLEPTRLEAIVEFCQKYEFSRGLGACDTILCGYFESTELDKFNREDYIGIYALVHRFRLEKSTAAGSEYLCDFLCDTDDRALITLELWKKLVPALAEVEELWKMVESIMGEEMPDGTKQEIVAEKCFPAMISNRVQRRLEWRPWK